MCLVELRGDTPLLSGESVAIKNNCQPHKLMPSHTDTGDQVTSLWKAPRAGRCACLEIVDCILVLQRSPAERSALGENPGRCRANIQALSCASLSCAVPFHMVPSPGSCSVVCVKMGFI